MEESVNDIDDTFQTAWEATVAIINVSQVRDDILALKSTIDDCCRITFSSTVNDIQDILQDNNPGGYFQNRKDFLKKFTLSGIPVYTKCPKSQLLCNPWFFTVDSFMLCQYDILSQVVREYYIDLQDTGRANDDNVVWLNPDKQEHTRFNAIVPIFRPDHVIAMSPMMNSPAYSIAVNYALTGMSYMQLNHEMHLATLGVTWLRILEIYNKMEVGEYVENRLFSLESTAAGYLNHNDIYLDYWNRLKSDTVKILAESDQLIKPMFILNHFRKTITSNKLRNMLLAFRLDYVKRCIRCKYPMTNLCQDQTFFNKLLISHSVGTALSSVTNRLKTMRLQLKPEFKLVGLEKQIARQIVISELENSTNNDNLRLCFSGKDLDRLPRINEFGDISWSTLEYFSLRLVNGDVSERDYTKNAFCDQWVCNYVYLVMYDKNSTTIEVTMGGLRRALTLEYLNMVSDLIYEKIHKVIQDVWPTVCSTYKTAYMYCQDYISTTENDLLLMSNACTNRNCPLYLIPKYLIDNDDSIRVCDNTCLNVICLKN